MTETSKKTIGASVRPCGTVEHGICRHRSISIPRAYNPCGTKRVAGIVLRQLPHKIASLSQGKHNTPRSLKSAINRHLKPSHSPRNAFNHRLMYPHGPGNTINRRLKCPHSPRNAFNHRLMYPYSPGNATNRRLKSPHGSGSSSNHRLKCPPSPKSATNCCLMCLHGSKSALKHRLKYPHGSWATVLPTKPLFWTCGKHGLHPLRGLRGGVRSRCDSMRLSR